MDDFGNDLSASGVVLSPDELKEKRKRDGQCSVCGQQCFRKKALRFGKKLLADAVLDRLEPLTVEGRVLNGRCLICNPQTQEELDQEELDRRVSEMMENVFDSGGEPGPKASEDSNDRPEKRLSDVLSRTKTLGKRAAFADSAKQTGGIDVAEISVRVESVDKKDDFVSSVATLSHDDFFAQFDVPGKKSSFEADAPAADRKTMGRSTSNDGPHAKSSPPMRRSDTRPPKRGSHEKASTSTRAERRPRRKNGDGRDARQPSKRGGREKAWRGRLAASAHVGSMDHSNSRTRLHSHTRGDTYHRRSKRAEKRGSTSSRRGSTNTRGSLNAQRQPRSDRIGKMMKKSQRNLKYARQKSRKRLKDARWESSGSSSSSGSDDGGSSSSSDSDGSSGSDDDGDGDDGASVASGKSYFSWREKVAPQEKMQSVLDHFAREAAGRASALAGAREAISTLKEEETSANKAKWFASKQLKDAQEQQAFAAEREDYEVADELGTVIRGNLKALKKQTRTYQDIQERMAKMGEKKEEAVRAATWCLREAQEELNELRDELAGHAKEEQGVVAMFSAESARLASESARLAKELVAIEQEEESFAIEKEEVLGGETKEFEEELEEASVKLLKVNDTVKELRRQLEKAEAEAVFLNKQIMSSKENISDIHFRYSKELAQLEFKFRLTKERRNIWESESKTVKETRSVHEAAMEAHAREVEMRERVIKMTEEERLAAADLEKIVADAFNAEATKKAQESNGNTAEVDEIVMYEALVDEKQELLFDAENNIEDLADEIYSIEARLPALEAKKKAAASARDFKLASRSSRKIKNALARREQCQAQLNGGARQREQSARDELERYVSLMEAKKKAVVERGREAGVERMERLREATSKLRFVLNKLANAPEGEATKISAIGGVLIDSQLSGLDEEGRALGEKYGGWEGVPPESYAVKKFLAPLVAKSPSTRLISGRTKLSILLDQKMGSSALGQSQDLSLKSLGEEEDWGHRHPRDRNTYS